MWLAIGRVVFAALIGALMQATHAQEGEGGAARARTPSASPDARKFVAAADQVVVIRAARMFDARSGKMLANPTIVVRGDRICRGWWNGTCRGDAHFYRSPCQSHGGRSPRETARCPRILKAAEQ